MQQFVLSYWLAGEASSYLKALIGEEDEELGDNPDDFPILYVTLPMSCC